MDETQPSAPSSTNPTSPAPKPNPSQPAPTENPGTREAPSATVGFIPTGNRGTLGRGAGGRRTFDRR